MKSIKGLSKKKKIILCILLTAAILLIAEFIRSNTVITVEEHTYKSALLPTEFDGVKIVQISDFHNASENYCDRLLEKVSKQEPDYIFMTGDIVDSIRTDVSRACYFLEEASKIAPCYIVWGNHDRSLSDSDMERMRSCCNENGITILDDYVTEILRDGQSVTVAGTLTTQGAGLDMVVDELQRKSIKLVLWLHHYPEDLEYISGECDRAGVEDCLMFSGHAHGGLFGIPFGNGVYAPGQGLLPEYTSGSYEQGNVTMLLSAGAGNSGYSLRLFNSFDIVVCTLECE